MAELIQFEKTAEHALPEPRDFCPLDDLGIAIQTLIEQMRRAPLQRTG